jgi:3-oxoacyl-[acyl-carrier protein] reductase
MDLGIAGKSAIICGARSGLGLACAQALSGEGVNLTLLSRDAAGLEAVAATIRTGHPGLSVVSVPGDLGADATRAALLQACPAPDILVLNAGGPPTGGARKWERADWEAALNTNLIASVLLVRDVLDGMVARRFGRILAITSGAVKAPLPFLALSNAARTGLWSVLKGLSREVAAYNVTINNMLPHAFETDRLRANFVTRAAQAGTTPEAVRAQSLAHIPAGRFGQPEEFGALAASLCSARLGYVTGQSIMLDGGHFEGLV